jgi:ABC-2 type transport system ATP-binding protein
VIEIAGLRKTYGDFPALQGLDLSVREGELYAFLGPNGAGKTTTIKILVGLIRATSGSARVAGLDVDRDAVEVKRVIGYVPDTPWLYDRLTAWESLRLIAGLHRMDAGRFRERAGALLDAFSISHRATGLVEDFSLGMRQKLCFAAAFLHEPRVVIIDEPWVGLDPRAVKDVVDFLKLRNREGCTVLMSTHSLAIAERIADRVGIVHRGRMIAEGTVDELLRLRRERELEELFLRLTEGDEAGGAPGP